MKRTLPLLALVLTITCYAFSQRADLSGLKICIDPGHGGYFDATDRHVVPDPGTNYYESESNYQKALHLKALLEAKGATVILTRYTNNYPTDAEPSLEARVTVANSNNVDWFHSIHSNAIGSVNSSTNYTLMLIREKRPGGAYSSSGNGLGVPETQEAWNISTLIGPNIRGKMRTKSLQQYLDWTFYGGVNGGISLGVLRGLSMPGELSEGEFHDYYPETRRLMNLSYCKMEAYALRDAFLQYFGVPADSLSQIAGIVSEMGTGKMIDAVQVRLLPENVVYTGDLYHNGFYMFDGIKPGPHTLRFETPGYKSDSAQVTVAVGSTTFIDRQTESLAAPVIVTSSPSNNDTAYSAAGTIQFVFSKIMDTASVRSNFSIIPSVRGSLIWSNNNITLTFKPDSVVLPFNTSYTIRLEGAAKSQSGLTLDGNGDGTPGDAYVLKFKTRPVDVWPPVMVASSPSATSATVASNNVINFTFDEPLDASSVNSTNIVVQEVGTGNRPLSFLYDARNGRGGINIFPQGGLVAGKSYKVRLSGVKDAVGNPLPSTTPLYTFSVGPQSYTFTTIEDFSTSVASWFQPGTSGSTVGVDSATFTRDSVITLSLLPATAKSGRLSYVWNTTTATDWLIREYLSGGPGRSVTWSKRGSRLQAYVYGDGSGTLFRFAVDDSVDAFPAGTTANHEVNQWLPIDWVGWRLVEWDFDNDSVGTWLGNGKVEGMLRFDSFQLKYPAGSKVKSGAIYVAQLQVAKGTATSVEQTSGAIPLECALEQNYPNPFNPSTNFEFRISNFGFVSLKIFDVLGREVATLVNDVRPAGTYKLRWDASALPSGVYFYQLRTSQFVQTKKLVLTK
jgi:N-acetylmuramoyl-L-alanine amidase